MIIYNPKTEFYDVIVDERVLLLVGLDVDALCASRILQCLFHCDNVLYSMIPVSSKTDLSGVFQQYRDQSKFVVMVNCGATIDLVDLLQPEEGIVFFVCDSRRPVDICNVYNDNQVRVLMKSEETEHLPLYDQIFAESSDEEDEEVTEESILRRRERRLWKENRQKILFDYTQYSYYELSTALIMFDLAWKLSRDTNELLWWAIVGLTDQYYCGKIEREKYVLSAASLQSHVVRHNHRDASTTNSDNNSSLKLSFEKELNLALYRHWSILESITHTRYTSCKFRLWTVKGIKKLHEFLAEIGIPLPQCRQKFTAMDSIYRSNIASWIEDISEKYKLDQIVYGSFACQLGFKGKFCAADIVLALNAILESPSEEHTFADNFLDAFETLSAFKASSLYHGIDLAKLQLSAIFSQVQSLINMNHVLSAGSFLYSVIEEHTSNVRCFGYPQCLAMLAHFILQAHVCKSKSQRSRSLPLVLMALDAVKPGYFLVVGIPPLSEESIKNFFGKAFEQAAQRSNVAFSQDIFDSSFINISENDKSKFFDALISILS